MLPFLRNDIEEDRIIAQSYSTIHTGWIEKVMDGNCDPIGISVIVFKSIKMNVMIFVILIIV